MAFHRYVCEMDSRFLHTYVFRESKTESIPIPTYCTFIKKKLRTSKLLSDLMLCSKNANTCSQKRRTSIASEFDIDVGAIWRDHTVKFDKKILDTCKTATWKSSACGWGKKSKICMDLKIYMNTYSKIIWRVWCVLFSVQDT